MDLAKHTAGIRTLSYGLPSGTGSSQSGAGNAPRPGASARRRVLLAAAVAAFSILAGAASPSARAQETIKIGEIQSQTGTFSNDGWMPSQGTRMAVDEINKAGGFEVAGKKYKFELISRDDQGDPQKALIYLKQLLGQDQVKFVFGPSLTVTYKAIEPYANTFNGKFLLLTQATAAHFDLGKPDHDYLMRALNWDSGPSGFGSLMVDYLKKLGVKKVAMLMHNDSAGHVAADIYRPLFKDAGIEFNENWFQAGTRDFSSELSQIAAWKPDYIWPGYTLSEIFDIVHQATELGMDRFWLARGSLGPGVKNQDYLSDYVIYVPKDFETAQKTEPNVQKFIENYKKFYSTTEFPYDQAPRCSDPCFDHPFMLAEAMKRAGTVDDVAKIKQALQSFTYPGLWNIRFDETGEEVFDFDIVALKKGGKTEITHVTPK